jgi:hypothetical protein
LGQLPGLACPRFADVRQHFVFFARLNAMSRKHLLVIGLAFSLAMIGCGGASSSSNGGGNSVAISVKLSTAPPASLQTGATATIAATVSNDSANKGVTWSCAPSNACGSFNPTQTASAATATYTAPANAPQGGTVTITATSVSDNTKTASASVSVTASISVSLSTAPPASLQTGATATIAATVSNDSANKGVTWSCAPSNACGSFTPTQTASGATTTYTAPASAPQGGSVTITAASVSDATKTASANVAIITTAPTIAVRFTTVPSGESIQTGATAVYAATVSNDSTNAGVTWSCYPTGSCGSFNPALPNGGATYTATYTAPATVPQTNLLTITATSVADSTKSASIFVTVYAPGTQNALLKGQYAFLITGLDITGRSAVAGSVTLDGNGNVTGGKQDFVDAVPANAQLNVPVTGTYAIYANGRGVMTLSYTFQNTPYFENFSFGATSSSHAVISETDGGNAGSGSLDLQSAGPTFTLAQIAGNYSFTLSGEDLTLANPSNEVEGGIVSLNAAGNLTNGTIDTNDGGTFSTSSFSGTASAPDSNGRGTFTTPGGASFAYYIVTPAVLRLVETDAMVVAGGTAFGQGTATIFTKASLSGGFVFHDEGFDNTRTARAVVGQFTTDGNGNITSGVEDANAGGTSSIINLAGATYSIAGSPRGTVTFFGGATFNVYLVDPKINIHDPNNANGGGGALLLETDTISSRMGEVIPQVSPATSTFLGNYSLNLVNLPLQHAGLVPSQDGTELVGNLTTNSSGASGLADYSVIGYFPATGIATTASSLTADASNPGRSTGTLTTPPPSNGFPFSLDNTGGNTGQISVAYYQISSTQLLMLGTSANEVIFGVLEQ